MMYIDEDPTFQIVGDNVDLWQTSSHQSINRSDKDHH